jgi:hypothetical protein
MFINHCWLPHLQWMPHFLNNQQQTKHGSTHDCHSSLLGTYGQHPVLLCRAATRPGSSQPHFDNPWQHLTTRPACVDASPTFSQLCQPLQALSHHQTAMCKADCSQQPQVHQVGLPVQSATVVQPHLCSSMHLWLPSSLPFTDTQAMSTTQALQGVEHCALAVPSRSAAGAPRVDLDTTAAPRGSRYYACLFFLSAAWPRLTQAHPEDDGITVCEEQLRTMPPF